MPLLYKNSFRHGGFSETDVTTQTNEIELDDVVEEAGEKRNNFLSEDWVRIKENVMVSQSIIDENILIDLTEKEKLSTMEAEVEIPPMSFNKTTEVLKTVQWFLF